MSLWNFQSPDIIYDNDVKVEIIWPAATGDLNTIAVISFKDYRYLPLRIHAVRKNLSYVRSERYHVWACTNEFRNRLCDYAPGHEDMPPLPDQCCHNCGGVRAERIPIASDVRLKNVRGK